MKAEMHDRLLDFHEQAKKQKEHLMHDHGERDMPPHVEGFFGDQLVVLPIEKAITAIGPLIEAAHQMIGERFRTSQHWLVHENLELAVKSFGPPEAIVAVFDGYEAPDEDHDFDSIAEDFSMNPFSQVVESLGSLVFVTDHVGGCEWAIIKSSYRVTDGGRIEWDETAAFDQTEGAQKYSGGIEDVIEPFFKKESLA